MMRMCKGENQQKIFRLNLLGSQIESSQAWLLDPSSDRLGVDGRNDCLSSAQCIQEVKEKKSIYTSEVTEEKRPGEYVTGESRVTLRA